jgi:hypothetical protein
MQASRIFRFARTIRWATVGSVSSSSRAIEGDRQTTHDAQGERDARCRVERRVAAGEQQRELVIPSHHGAVRLSRSPVLHGFALLPDTGRLSAQVVDGAAPSDRNEPSARVGGYAVMEPLRQRCGACFLRAVLSHRQVADEPGDRRRGGPPRVAEDPVNLFVQRGPITISGRTSTDPYLADGIVAACRSAVSRSLQSRM